VDHECGRPNGTQLQILQKNHEMDREIRVIFAAYGYFRQFHIVKKNTPKTRIGRTRTMLSRISYLLVFGK